MNIGISCQTKDILCHLKITTFLKQIKLKKSNVYKWGEKGNIKKKKPKKKGKRNSIIYKNRIYFEKKPQTGTGVVAEFIASFLESVGDDIRV